jgi:ABC-type uncharacterized transport system fused permease/ATPase subunit
MKLMEEKFSILMLSRHGLKRTMILSCGVALALVALKRSKIKASEQLDIEKTTDKSRKKKSTISSKRSWQLVLNILKMTKDPHTIKIIVAMMGCAFVFSVVDVRKAFVSGQMFRTVFEGDKSRFKNLLAFNIGLSLVLTVFNKILANLVSSLGRHWHFKLVNGIHDLYFSGNNYYKIQNLIELPHERIATDAPQLTRDLALMSCDLVNAFINFAVFSRQVYKFGKRIAGDRTWGGLRLVAGPVGYALIGSFRIWDF